MTAIENDGPVEESSQAANDNVEQVGHMAQDDVAKQAVIDDFANQKAIDNAISGTASKTLSEERVAAGEDIDAEGKAVDTKEAERLHAAAKDEPVYEDENGVRHTTEVTE
jgi:hypothetical protein